MSATSIFAGKCQSQRLASLDSQQSERRLKTRSRLCGAVRGCPKGYEADQSCRPSFGEATMRHRARQGSPRLNLDFPLDDQKHASNKYEGKPFEILTCPDSSGLGQLESASVSCHASLLRKPSASAESALASCLAVSGAGSGILRNCPPVAGSRSIHGCGAASGLLAAARAATNCAPTCARACHGSGPASSGGAPTPSVGAIAISPAPMSTSTFASSADAAS